jgi:hypothetical protein
MPIVIVDAADRSFQGWAELGPGRHILTPSGQWKSDNGRPYHVAGGNGPVPQGDYPKTFDGAGEGCLLVYVSTISSHPLHWTDDSGLAVVGPCEVRFLMNDNNFGDNFGRLTITIS